MLKWNSVPFSYFGGLHRLKRKTYSTKQRDAIIMCFRSLEGEHITAAQVLEYCISQNLEVGRTTVYRILNNLVEDGVIRRYEVGSTIGACYQYIDNLSECSTHLHLVCEDCGQLQHLECDALYEIQEHINTSHSFRVNSLKTVLYGLCDSCLKSHSS